MLRLLLLLLLRLLLRLLLLLLRMWVPLKLLLLLLLLRGWLLLLQLVGLLLKLQRRLALLSGLRVRLLLLLRLRVRCRLQGVGRLLLLLLLLLLLGLNGIVVAAAGWGHGCGRDRAGAAKVVVDVKRGRQRGGGLGGGRRPHQLGWEKRQRREASDCGAGFGPNGRPGLRARTNVGSGQHRMLGGFRGICVAGARPPTDTVQDRGPVDAANESGRLYLLCGPQHHRCQCSPARLQRRPCVGLRPLC